jgi:hypothetical protein
MIVGATITYASFVDQMPALENRMTHGILGSAISLLGFFLGYVVLSYTNHSIRRITMYHKHIGEMRGKLMSILKDYGLKDFRSYLLATDSELRIPRHIRDKESQFAFAALNLAVLAIHMRFLPMITKNSDIQTSITLVLMGLIIIWYSGFLERLNIEILATRNARSLNHEFKLLEIADKFRKESSKIRKLLGISTWGWYIFMLLFIAGVNIHNDIVSNELGKIMAGIFFAMTIISRIIMMFVLENMGRKSIEGANLL